MSGHGVPVVTALRIHCRCQPELTWTPLLGKQSPAGNSRPCSSLMKTLSPTERWGDWLQAAGQESEVSLRLVETVILPQMRAAGFAVPGRGGPCRDNLKCILE